MSQIKIKCFKDKKVTDSLKKDLQTTTQERTQDLWRDYSQDRDNESI